MTNSKPVQRVQATGQDVLRSLQAMVIHRRGAMNQAMSELIWENEQLKEQLNEERERVRDLELLLSHLDRAFSDISACMAASADTLGRICDELNARA
jgi:hypothetical protein